MGKSAQALYLAQGFDGEIINADSRQVYRYMDIGTAKPSLEAQAQVPHHLVDILDPDQEFSLAMYLQLAGQAIWDIQSTGRLPIVTGGTGQYIWALLEGWQVPPVPPDAQLRHELEEKAKQEGVEALHKRLLEVDADSASRIGPHNLRRLIRALEIYHATGIAPSTMRRKGSPPYRSLVIGLHMQREELYRRIDRRIEGMIDNGLLGEVGKLLRMGYSPDLPCMSSMGYKEIALHLNGELTLEEASHRIKYETHRFARRQYAWFRLNDPRIHWLRAGAGVNDEAVALVEGWFRQDHGCVRIASGSKEKGQ